MTRKNRKVAIVIIDSKKRVLYANLFFEQLTGYSLADIQGKKFSFLQWPKTDTIEVSRLNTAIYQGRDFQGSLTCYRKDNSTFINEIQMYYIDKCQNRKEEFIIVQRIIEDNIELLISDPHLF